MQPFWSDNFETAHPRPHCDVYTQHHEFLQRVARRFGDIHRGIKRVDNANSDDEDDGEEEDVQVNRSQKTGARNALVSVFLDYILC